MHLYCLLQSFINFYGRKGDDDFVEWIRYKWDNLCVWCWEGGRPSYYLSYYFTTRGNPVCLVNLAPKIVFWVSLQYIFSKCWYPWMLFFGWIGEHHIPNYVTSIPAMNNSLESSASGNSTNPANFHDHYCETRRKFTPEWFTSRGWKCLFCAPRHDIVKTDTAPSHHFLRDNN